MLSGYITIRLDRIEPNRVTLHASVIEELGGAVLMDLGPAVLTVGSTLNVKIDHIEPKMKLPGWTSG